MAHKNKKNILVTGGAGFIGSNLVNHLLQNEQVGLVRVIDNLSTGSLSNIDIFQSNPNFEFIEGDIRDFKTCKMVCQDIHAISHQAALGSVPRSIKDPITTNDVNINGTLNIFKSAHESGIKRVVYASSSSVYGDSKELPKIEDKIGKPLSPYAVTKYVSELYANIFGTIYEMEMIGLRYFNIFGSNQSPNGPYAAVIPLFIQALKEGKSPTINGDGSISRDFTYVANAVNANVLALFTQNQSATNQVYNIACGQQTTLNNLFFLLKKRVGNLDIEPNYGPNRTGDIFHSLADISLAKYLLGYTGEISIEEGIQLMDI